MSVEAVQKSGSIVKGTLVAGAIGAAAVEGLGYVACKYIQPQARKALEMGKDIFVSKMTKAGKCNEEILTEAWSFTEQIANGKFKPGMARLALAFGVLTAGVYLTAKLISNAVKKNKQS